MKKEEVEKCRNVAFHIPESLIAEIDNFCTEKGGVPRKEYFYDLIETKARLEKEAQALWEQLCMTKDRANELYVYKEKTESVLASNEKLILEMIADNNKIATELTNKSKAYSELFTSTLKYRTFGKRLINLFSKF